MFIEDYGLWFEAFEVKRDHKGRVKIGIGWKHPVITYGRVWYAPTDLVIQTDNLQDLEKACVQPDWGYVALRENGVGLVFLVEHVKDICHSKIMLLLNSSKLDEEQKEIAQKLEDSLIQKFGHPTVNGVPQDEESILRDLYYKKFGIELPS